MNKSTVAICRERERKDRGPEQKLCQAGRTLLAPGQ